MGGYDGRWWGGEQNLRLVVRRGLTAGGGDVVVHAGTVDGQEGPAGEP